MSGFGSGRGAREHVLPARLEPPLDDDDYRYTASFPAANPASEEAAAWFAKFGFVIFPGAASAQDGSAGRTDIWAQLASQSDGLVPGDQRTWGQALLTRFGMPKHRGPVFRAPLLRLRQSPDLHRCFQAVMNGGGGGDTDTNNCPPLVCSFDRWLLHRGGAEKPEWRTERNIHLDLNPWEFVQDEPRVYDRLAALRYATTSDFIRECNDVASGMGRCVQGILNLQDNFDDQEGCGGGTILVPGFHTVFDSWVCGAADPAQRCSGAMQYKVLASDPLNKLAVRATLRAGSLLIWDQRLMHGSAPNTSPRCRYGLPIRCFNAALMSPQRARARSDAVRREIAAAGFEDQLTATGRAVFGLQNAAARKTN